MNTIVRKALALITVAFFTFSSPSPVSLYAWPWSKAPNNNTQGNDLSTTANIDGSASGGTASGRASAQASGSNFNASGDALVGTNIGQGVAGAEVRGQASSNIGGIPANATGSALTTGRGTIDSSGHPSVDFQTQTNLTGSVGGRYSTQGSGSVSSGPIAQNSFTRQSQSGNASLQGSARRGAFDATGGYSATANSSGAQATVHGSARAVVTEGEVRGHYRTGSGSTTIEVTGSGQQFVGVEGTGRGHVSVNRSGISGGGEVDLIAGARQRVEVGGTLNLLGLVKITTKLKGESIEGGGVNAHATVQASGRGIAISTGFAAATGLGGGLATEFEVDVSGITEPIGKAIDATAGAIGRGAKNLWDKIFGKKEEKKAEEEPACAAEGDFVHCAGGVAAGGGPRPNPQPDPAEEARRRQEERRREREEEEQKRREKEEKEQKRREKEEREKEERKKKGEETWRKLPPLSKPKSGGATGRTLDPDTGEITEGVMEPDGSTVITKRDSDGNVIGVEKHPGRYQDRVSSSAESDQASKTDAGSSLPLESPQPLQAGPEDGFTQVPDVRKLAAQKYARVDHDLKTDNYIIRDLNGKVIGYIPRRDDADLRTEDIQGRTERFSRMNADELKQAMRESQEQIDRAQSDMIGTASEIHIAEQKLDKLEEQKQNAKRMGFDTTTIDGKIEQVKGEIKSAEYRVQDAGDRAENARRNMQAADQRLSQLKSLKMESSQSKAQVQVPNRVTTNRPSDSSNFDAFDAMQGGGITMLTHQKTTPTAVLDGAPNSRDMNPGTFTVDQPAEANGYKSDGSQCELN